MATPSAAAAPHQVTHSPIYMQTVQTCTTEPTSQVPSHCRYLSAILEQEVAYSQRRGDNQL